MKLYNTLTRSVEPFSPLAPPAVTMYVCGPTVYDEPHIGHARSAFIFDMLRRYLTHRGYQVTFVRNVTDVDDKIIEKARQELATSDKRQATSNLNARCREVAERYLKSYHETMDRLGINRPDIEPLATEHVVPEMTDFISKLLMQGAAYEAEGDVYFSVRKFQGYGTLSNRALDELQAGARVEPGEHKQDPLDFALWKAAKPGEPFWKSPWGDGRPGWHIECSAMSTKYLGEAFDIHGGGVDLIFPHHENEVAQARAAGKPFARCWVHNGLLTVNGEKMSKSLGNFITLDQALIESHNQPDVIKVFFLSSHYRSPVDYNSSRLTAAYQRWFGLKLLLQDEPHFRRDWEEKWKEHFPNLTVPEDRNNEIIKIEEGFTKAMDDDLNTPEALACLDALVRLTNTWRERVHLEEKASASQAMEFKPVQSWALDCLSVVRAAEKLTVLGNLLGLFQVPVRELTTKELEKIHERDNARKRGNFQVADDVRRKLLEEGIELRDTPYGTLWHPKRPNSSRGKSNRRFSNREK